MSRLYDAMRKSSGQLGEIGRNLVNTSSSPAVPEDDVDTRTDTCLSEESMQPAKVEAATLVPVQSGIVELEEPAARNAWRQPVLTLVALMALSAIGYSAWRAYHGQNILASWLGQSTSASSLRFTGVVVAQETIVAAKIPGRIERLLVDEGSFVKAGDLIASLDRQETRAEHDSQRAKVDQLNSRLTQTEEMLRLEKEKNQYQLDRAAAQLKATESELRTAEVELEQSRKDLNRGRDLQQAGVIPAQDIERYQTAVAVNETRVKSIEQRIMAGRADVDLMRSNLRQVAVAASDVEQTRAQLLQAQASRQQTEVRLAYSTIRAPISGLVSVRVARQGEIVGVGTPIVTIVDLEDIWVKADIEETWINRIHIGARLPVELASGTRSTGEVFFISPEAEFATQRDISRVKRDIRTFGIKVRLSNESRRIHPGMTAYVMLPTSPAAGMP